MSTSHDASPAYQGRSSQLLARQARADTPPVDLLRSKHNGVFMSAWRKEFHDRLINDSTPRSRPKEPTFGPLPSTLPTTPKDPEDPLVLPWQKTLHYAFENYGRPGVAMEVYKLAKAKLGTHASWKKIVEDEQRAEGKVLRLLMGLTDDAIRSLIRNTLAHDRMQNKDLGKFVGDCMRPKDQPSIYCMTIASETESRLTANGITASPNPGTFVTPTGAAQLAQTYQNYHENVQTAEAINRAIDSDDIEYARLGEILGSLLCSSYWIHGGLNPAHAGNSSFNTKKQPNWGTQIRALAKRIDYAGYPDVEHDRFDTIRRAIGAIHNEAALEAENKRLEQELKDQRKKTDAVKEQWVKKLRDVYNVRKQVLEKDERRRLALPLSSQSPLIRKIFDAQRQSRAAEMISSLIVMDYEVFPGARELAMKEQPDTVRVEVEARIKELEDIVHERIVQQLEATHGRRWQPRQPTTDRQPTIDCQPGSSLHPFIKPNYDLRPLDPSLQPSLSRHVALIGFA